VIRAYLIGGAVVAFAIASVAAAQPAPPLPPGVAQGTTPGPMMPPPPGAPRIRVMLDDGHVMSRDEVAKHVTELFARLDINHDGFVTKEEVEAFHQKFAGMAQMGQDMAERARGMAEMGRAMTERYSHRDMPMPERGAMFDRLDANHDGVISRAEFMAGRPEIREERMMIMRPDAHGAIPPMPPMPPMDGHPGMNMGMHMHHMGGMGMGGFGGRLFEMADANHDGRVSLAEAQAAALAHFDKADINHDGRISPDEHMQVREEMRIERHPS
jgi:hypothetical protein